MKAFSEYGMQGTARSVQRHDKTADSVSCCEWRYFLVISIGVDIVTDY